jgi:hypothetical protein
MPDHTKGARLRSDPEYLATKLSRSRAETPRELTGCYARTPSDSANTPAPRSGTLPGIPFREPPMNENDDTRTAAPQPDPNGTATDHRAANGATRNWPEAERAQLATEIGFVSIPGYQIESVLGRGAFGVVYKATQSGLNRIVALKMLIAGPYASSAARARFLLEAESVAALEHPHVVKVFAFGEEGGHPYLAMEFLPGGTLDERIRKGGPLPAKEATELLAKLAGAVAHAHSHGVVHRDIKPLNVLLTDEGEPRLTDFGLAKVGRADQNLSVTGQVLGTPAYMAPEQAAGKVHEVGTAADVYALGAVLYDVLTGRPPFVGDSVAVTLQQVLSEEPQRPRTLIASIPPDLETICLKCLEKDPKKRYATAQTVADDLNHFLSGEPITARPARSLERAAKWVKRNKGLTVAAATVILALAVGSAVAIGFGVQSSRDAERAKEEAERADREAAEAKRLEAEVREALTKSRDLAGQLKAALDESRRRVSLNYLAYSQMCATAARIANTANRHDAGRLLLDYQRASEWVAESGDPAVKAASADFTAATAEWSAGPPPSSLRQRSLRLARACRDSWLKDVAREFPELAEQIRTRLYTRACATASGLLASGDPARVRRCREEFWELYWGELAIVETTTVEQKMAALGTILERWSPDEPAPSELSQAVAELHAACGVPFTVGK